MLENLLDSKKPNCQPLTITGCDGDTCHFSLDSDTQGHATCGIHVRGQLKMGSEIKGTDLHLAKRGSGNVTSSCVAMRTRPTRLSSYSMIQGRGGMESIQSKKVSLSR